MVAIALWVLQYNGCRPQYGSYCCLSAAVRCPSVFVWQPSLRESLSVSVRCLSCVLALAVWRPSLCFCRRHRQRGHTSVRSVSFSDGSKHCSFPSCLPVRSHVSLQWRGITLRCGLMLQFRLVYKNVHVRSLTIHSTPPLNTRFLVITVLWKISKLLYLLNMHLIKT